MIVVPLTIKLFCVKHSKFEITKFILFLSHRYMNEFRLKMKIFEKVYKNTC